MERVALSVDVVCFALIDATLHVLLVRRTAPPFAHCWALPGGVVRARESLEAAADRILHERTGMTTAYLEQLYTFGDPDRDPRGRTLSVAYSALVPVGEHPLAVGRDVSAVAWHRVDALADLAFDHARIVAYARWRLGQKIDYAPILFRVLPDQFTMRDLYAAVLAIKGLPAVEVHYSNFTSSMIARWHLETVPGVSVPSGARPAKVYRYTGDRTVAGPPPVMPPTSPSCEEETR